MIQCGVQVDVPGLLKETPLHFAAKNGFWELADVLVQSGGNVNARNFPMQETPLHLAVRNGHQHLAEFLIHHGSQVNAKNVPMQETPLHLAVRNGHQHLAEFLIHHGSQVNAKNVPMKETPLHLASRNGHQQIAEFLIRQGCQVNARNLPWQETPLHVAVKNGHQHIVELLIKHGSQVDARNVPMQETPLHLASRNGHRKTAKFLIQHGSNVNARNLPMEETPLHLAVENGHQRIAELLIQHGSDINVRNNEEEISLHLAARNGHHQLAELLIQHGSLVNARNGPLQETPLHLASEHGHNNIVELLIQHGSEVNARKRESRETPLYLAAKNGHKLVEEVLICHRSDLDVWDLFDLAKQNGHERFVEVSIIERGDTRRGLFQTLSISQMHVSELLIQHVSGVSAKSSSKQKTPLHLTLKVLTKHDICVNAQNGKKKVLLYLVAKNSHGHFAKVVIDLASVITVNFRYSNQQTPLNFAVRNSQRRIEELLRQYGESHLRGNLVKDFRRFTRFRMTGCESMNHWQHSSRRSVLLACINKGDLSGRNQTNNHSPHRKWIKMYLQVSLFKTYGIDHYVIHNVLFQHLFHQYLTLWLDPNETLLTLTDLVHFDLFDTKPCKLLCCAAVPGVQEKDGDFKVLNFGVWIFVIVVFVWFACSMYFFKHRRKIVHALPLEKCVFSHMYFPLQQPTKPGSKRLYSGDEHEKETAHDISYVPNFFTLRSCTEMKTMWQDEGVLSKPTTEILSGVQRVSMWLDRYYGAFEIEGNSCNRLDDFTF